MSLPSQRIRLHVNTKTRKIGLDVITDDIPRILKPGETQFEIALFDDDGEALKDIAGLDQITLYVKAQNPRTGLAVMQRTVSSGDINFLLTLEEWRSGEPDACHAKFNFTATETNVELDDDEVEFYTVIAGLSDDDPAKEVPFGNGVLVIEESGAFTDAPASVTDAQFYTKEQSDARYLLAADLTGKMNRAGDTMTGALTLSGDPTSALHAATKQYVDAGDAAADAAKQDTITGAATTITSANLTTNRALVSDGSGKVAVASVTATELGYVGGVTSALQTQLNGKQASVTGGASTILSSNLTASRALVSDGSGKVAAASVTATELGHVAGVTSALQTQLNGKQASVTGGATTIVSSNLTASRVLVSDTNGKVAIATATTTEVDYLTGVTSGIQTQLTNRLQLSGGTLTGALTLSGSPSSGLHATTKTYVDAADALKLNLTGGTLTGALQFSGGTNYGVRLANFASNELPSGSAQPGVLIYDTSGSYLRFWTGSTWKVLNDSPGGINWFDGAGDPDGGIGANGDYYVETQDDDDEGTIWKKASGTWSVIKAPALKIRGGTLTGALNFEQGLAWAIEFGGNWNIKEDVDEFSFHRSGVMEAMRLVYESGETNLYMLGGALKCTSGLFVNGDKVIGNQEAAIADCPATSSYTATSGGYGFATALEFTTFITEVNQIIDQLNALLAAVREGTGHGLIAA